MSIIAHRGYSYKYRENTLCAIREAIKKNVECVEVDINLIDNTNEYIIWHDRIDKETLCKLDEGEEHKICSLDNFINFLKFELENLMKNNKLKLLLDLKFDEDELSTFMKNEFDKIYSVIDKIDNLTLILQTSVMNGFQKYECINNRDKQKLMTSYLYCPEDGKLKNKQFWKYYEYLKISIFGIDMSYLANIDEIMLNIYQINLFNYFIIKIQLFIYKLFGFPMNINVYTINNKLVIKLLQLIGVNGIVTDDP